MKRVLAALFLTCFLTCTCGFLFSEKKEEDNSFSSFSGQNGVPFIKQNFVNKLNMELNDRINSSLVASYVYLSMAYWFDRADVALSGFHKYFLEASHRARDDTESLMKYINKRGGFMKLRKIKNPPTQWGNGLKAMEDALGMEKELNKNMLKTHELAERDPHLTNYIEDKFLEPKVDLIKELGDHVTRLRSFKKDYYLGEFILDKDLHD